MRRPLFALLTDYGPEDFFVASLKGVLLSLQPEAELVDITHDVPPFDVLRAAYILEASYRTFPRGTIFIVVVDPGVGTGRRILVARTGSQSFVAPDNGVLSGVLRREKLEALVSAEDGRFFLPGPGQIFDGRDKMAPVAAWLSHGCAPSEFGPKVGSWKKIPILGPRLSPRGIEGHVVYIDRFGNCITDVPSASVRGLRRRDGKGEWLLTIRGETASFAESYAFGRKGRLVFLPGSQGTIEIAAREDSAAARVGAVVGDPVSIRIAKAGDRDSGRAAAPTRKP